MTLLVQLLLNQRKRLHFKVLLQIDSQRLLREWRILLLLIPDGLFHGFGSGSHLQLVLSQTHEFIIIEQVFHF